MDTPSGAGRYGDIIKKYAALAARDPKEARYWTEERMLATIARVEGWVESRDYERLRHLRFRETNPFSREVFTAVTGITLPKRQSDCLKVIEEFVGPDAVAAYHAKEQGEREARDRQYLISRVSSRLYVFEGRTIPCSEFIDTAIGRGFVFPSSKRRGAALQYRLADAEGKFYRLRRDEHDYAQLRLKQLAGPDEPPAPPPAVANPPAPAIVRLARHLEDAACILKAMLALTNEEADSHPHAYAKPDAPLSGLLLPPDVHGIIFRPDDGGGEVLLTSAPLNLFALEAHGLFPANTDARLALAEEAAPSLAVKDSIVLAKPDSEYGVAVHRTGKHAGYQLTHFDPDGLSSDHEVRSLGAGLLEAVRMGFTEHRPSMLSELAATDRFAAGVERTSIARGLTAPEHLHHASVNALAHMVPHEFDDYLGLVECAAPSPADLADRLAAICQRWDTHGQPRPERAGRPPHEEANHTKLVERLTQLRALARPRARTREQLVRDFAAAIADMPAAAELVNVTPALEAVVSLKDQAGEMLAELIEGDNPPQHRTDEYNLSWSGEGGTDAFLEEIARLAYVTLHRQLTSGAHAPTAAAETTYQGAIA